MGDDLMMPVDPPPPPYIPVGGSEGDHRAAEPDAGDVETLAGALHRAFHEHWHPGKSLDLYADSPLWREQAKAVAATADQARRESAVEAGERIAQAIEADCDHPASDQCQGCSGMRRAARIARSVEVSRNPSSGT